MRWLEGIGSLALAPGDPRDGIDGNRACQQGVKGGPESIDIRARRGPTPVLFQRGIPRCTVADKGRSFICHVLLSGAKVNQDGFGSSDRHNDVSWFDIAMDDRGVLVMQ